MNLGVKEQSEEKSEISLGASYWDAELTKLSVPWQPPWIAIIAGLLRRDLIDSGRLRRLIEEELRGMTSNPFIFESSRLRLRPATIRAMALRGKGAEQSTKP